VKKKQNNPSLAGEMKTNYNFKAVFTEKEEKSLVDYIEIRARMAYGLTSVETRKAAYIFAVANQLQIPTTWLEKEIAGRSMKIFS
jgi:hypothetical protein